MTFLLTRELEHQNMSLKERLVVARNQLMGGTNNNKTRREVHPSIYFLLNKFIHKI